jgi:LysM repeat protein
MKFKILFTSAFFLLFSASLFAKSFVDSVGVKNNDGKKMILYKIKAGDTYYSIGRRYHIKPDAIMKFNGAKKATLTLGKIIDIPTEIPFKKSSKAKETADVPKKETVKAKKERLAREAKLEREKKKRKREEENTPDNTETAAAQQPVAEPAAQQPVQPPVQQPVQNTAPPFQYRVSAGETLYSISKRFNTTVEILTKLNNLTSTDLQAGQMLLVQTGSAVQPQVQTQPAVAATSARPAVQRDSTSVVIINKDSSERHFNANRFGLFEKTETGVATWMDDPGLDPNKKLVLHRTAPIGTVIKITNPMTNRTTFAKVVGRFTDNESTKDVIIVMTKNVADALGALDKRFHVDISYGSPNE